jgi:hypothetical protein
LRKRVILLYGRTRAGKTAQIGELAEHVMATLGKKSLVYTIDKGGTGPLIPYMELGLIDLVCIDETDPWHFMNRVSNVFVRDEKGKWVKADLSNYGMIGNESLTGFSDAFMASLAEKSAGGLNVGGAANVNFVVNDGTDSMKIGGNNMGHYNVVQTQLLKEFWNSQRLDVPFIVWTASSTRDDDVNSSGKVIGPAVAGKALTSELPRHCDLCFRIDCTPAQSGKPERHILYLGNSVDMAAGNATSLGNTRIPLGGPELPATIEPASLVKALKLIEEAEKKAKEVIEKRLKEAQSSNLQKLA